jgi:hypothetical protein
MKENAPSVKITSAPIKEVVVHESILVSFDDLLRSRITPAGSVPLYWCNGILFTFSSMPWSKDVIRDYLDGRLHWIEVQYTRMDHYRQVAELRDENFGAQAQRVRVIDTSASLVHQELTRWLKAKL